MQVLAAANGCVDDVFPACLFMDAAAHADAREARSLLSLVVRLEDVSATKRSRHFGTLLGCGRSACASLVDKAREDPVAIPQVQALVTRVLDTFDRSSGDIALAFTLDTPSFWHYAKMMGRSSSVGRAAEAVVGLHDLADQFRASVASGDPRRTSSALRVFDIFVSKSVGMAATLFAGSALRTAQSRREPDASVAAMNLLRVAHVSLPKVRRPENVRLWSTLRSCVPLLVGVSLRNHPGTLWGCGAPGISLGSMDVGPYDEELWRMVDGWCNCRGCEAHDFVQMILRAEGFGMLSLRSSQDREYDPMLTLAQGA